MKLKKPPMPELPKRVFERIKHAYPVVTLTRNS